MMIDHVLDEEIQVKTRHDLTAAREVAHRRVRNLYATIGVLLVISLVIGTGAAVTVSRGIVRPIRRLIEGAEKIGGGALDHRIEVTARDEIGALTAAFNQMTAKGQEAGEFLSRQAQELVRANADLETFSYSVSHDLRAPLRGMKASVKPCLKTMPTGWTRSVGIMPIGSPPPRSGWTS